MSNKPNARKAALSKEGSQMKRSNLPKEQRDKIPLPRKGESQDQYYKRVYGIAVSVPKKKGR